MMAILIYDDYNASDRIALPVNVTISCLSLVEHLARLQM